jgi:hypothetical protein
MISVVDDIKTCQRLWQRLMPTACLFDLWEVRACFHEQYRYRPRFIVTGGDSAPTGLLALSEIDEHGYWGCFPGETFNGKTWLEQNRIVADTPQIAKALLDHCPQPAHLRYLNSDSMPDGAVATVDEVGYLFRPADYGYSFDRYFGAFSGKSRKKLQRELAGFEADGVRFRHDTPGDATKALEMNLAAFEDRSYFADHRFLSSFRSLVGLLHARQWLRVTTLLVGDRVAAIDVGAVYRGVYTVLAGGTDPSLRGVAKIINLHHLKWACHQRLNLVDFLCGDFGWKERFHLKPRPLYQVQTDDVGTNTAAKQAEVLNGVA